jgi:hypothetical protein
MKEKITDAYWWCYRFRDRYLRWRYYWYGLKNLWYFFPVIWNDRWWDHTFLTTLMYYKLRHMEKNFLEYGLHVRADRDAENIGLAKNLCKRISDDDYFDDYGHSPEGQQRDVDLLCTILKNHLLEWWD